MIDYTTLVVNEGTEMAGTRKPPEEPAAEPEEAKDLGEPAEKPTVIEALSRVMGDVQSVSKTGRNTQQNYNFRGIDAVVNAVGPALREHGVVVVPITTRADSEHYMTKSGAQMKGVELTVRFRFYGPAGDYIDAEAVGEASDAGDKAMPKAHSVAFRTLLLQALCIPTDEPDPDESSYERAQPFRGSTGSEPRPQERRQETVAYNWPGNPRELAERMASCVGKEESAEWMKQAVAVATGDTLPYNELPEDQKRIAWDVLTKALRGIEAEGELQIHPSPRETVAAIFAEQLDGQILAGPPWALTGAEAESGHPPKSKPDETVAEDATEEFREPTDEEIAEAQAKLDEEAAEAAKSDA